MTNREKVIKGLEACSMAGTKDDCIGYGYPYLIYNDEVSDDCQEQMFDDTLALLKAQEPVKPISCKSYIHTEPITFDYECPICMTGIMRNWVACPICGKAVKWDG